jgi:hypothetical protein
MKTGKLGKTSPNKVIVIIFKLVPNNTIFNRTDLFSIKFYLIFFT